MSTSTPSDTPGLTTSGATAVQDARDVIVARQQQYAKHRGRKALAQMIADAFITIETVIGSTTIHDQALILSAYQVSPATLNTSPYSPWIATCWGEPDHDVPAIEDLDGVERPKWRPDQNMKVYFHTMEKLHEEGFSANSKAADIVSFIMRNGGSQAVANKRKQGIADANKPGLEATNKERRDLFLAEGPQQPISLSVETLGFPANVGRYVSIIVERSDDGTLIYRGLADKDATAKLNKLAHDRYADLLEKREQRKIIDLEVEKARREARAEALAEIKQAG